MLASVVMEARDTESGTVWTPGCRASGVTHGSTVSYDQVGTRSFSSGAPGAGAGTMWSLNAGAGTMNLGTQQHAASQWSACPNLNPAGSLRPLFQPAVASPPGHGHAAAVESLMQMQSTIVTFFEVKSNLIP